MSTERHVVLGLATPRARWFTEVARWATSGAVPVEFVKCISPEELRVRLDSGRPYSCLLVDAASGVVDRELMGAARDKALPVLVVDPDERAQWIEDGAAAVLPAELTRERLTEALDRHSRPLSRADVLPATTDGPAAPPSGRSSPLVAVTGRAGVGVSTTAIALAQGLAEGGRDVVLADLRLDADLALLHDARDVVPGLQELVEAHRRGPLSTEAVRALTFFVVARRYHLLLGLRRHQDWTGLRREATASALQGLRAAFEVVVTDVGSDVEGEHGTGSVEVEERNLLARTTLGEADLVLVVGRPDLGGLHGVAHVVARLRAHGVESSRILTVLNRSPHRGRRRAELTRALAELTSDPHRPAVLGPLHLPRRDGLDLALRDGVRLHPPLGRTLARATAEILETLPAAMDPTSRPERIAPGTLGLTGTAVAT